MGYKQFKIQLSDHVTKESIIDAGGACIVTATGALAKLSLFSDKNGTVATNPVALTRGQVEFFVLDTVNSVDLFIDCPNGHFVVVKDVKPMGPNEIYVDQNQRQQTMVIPFSITDFAAAAETDTGFDTRPTTGRVFLPSPAVKVATADTGIVIDVGTDGAGSNDPDGLIDGISLAAATVVIGTMTNGSRTMGALLHVQDSANAGDLVPEGHFNATDENITATIAASGDTGEGYIFLPYQLNAI